MGYNDDYFHYNLCCVNVYLITEYIKYFVFLVYNFDEIILLVDDFNIDYDNYFIIIIGFFNQHY